MSTFTLNSITVQGLNVIAKLVAGSTLVFTRIAVGDGAMPSDKTPLTVTDLTHKLFDVDINSVVHNGNQSATVTGIFSNADRETGFFYRELGLFAKDPDTQAEFLYCYGNAGADAEWISPSGASSVIEKEVKIVTLVGNAETVTAEIKSGIYATKEELEEGLALKADLDAPAEDGGRVLAAQMRFDADQTLYVDAAAAEGGDGSEAKPFKTIQAAINAHYKGAAVIFIRIKPGTYAENLSVPRSPGTTWRIMREGTGTVAINTAVIDNCNYIFFDNLTFNGPAQDNSTIIYVANTGSLHLNAVTINGTEAATGINFNNSRGIMRSASINNCGLAIAATEGSLLDLKSNGGTGNTRALHADGSVIVCDYYVPAATTPTETVNGGVISVQGGTASFPSNYTPAYSLGDFTEVQALKTALLAQFGALGIGEKRDCWFACNIAAGFGPFSNGQRMQCSILKNTNNGSGYGIILFYSHHNAPAAFMQIQDGAFAQDVPVKFITNNDVATTQSPGVVQLADETAALAEKEAAVHVPLMYEINDFRRMNKAYSVGDKVNCAFKHELFLECTQAGTTSNSTLDTRNVTHGQVITDGTVKWTVRTHIKSVNGVVADKGGNVSIDSFAQTDIPENADLDDYMDAGFYICMYSNIVSTVKNKPESNGAFYMQVVRGRLTTQRYQILYNAGTNTLWTRSNINGTSWTNWAKLSKSTDLNNYLPLSAGINNRLTNSLYMANQCNIYANLASSAENGKQVGLFIAEPATTKSIRFVGFSSRNGEYTAACMGVGENVYAQGFRVTEDKLQFKQQDIVYVVEDYCVGVNWYRKWSNGWLEQGGRLEVQAGTKLLTLHKPFANLNYLIMATDVGDARYAYGIASYSTTQASINIPGQCGVTWRAEGMGAEE